MSKAKVIGLVFVNRQAPEEPISIPHQLQSIRSAVEEHNRDLTESLDLEVGDSADSHLQLLRIFRLLQSGAIDGVVVADLDRVLHPRDFEYLAVFDLLSLASSKVYAPGQVFAFDSPQGRFFVHFWAGVRGHERNLLRDQISRSPSMEEQV